MSRKCYELNISVNNATIISLLHFGGYFSSFLIFFFGTRSKQIVNNALSIGHIIWIYIAFGTNYFYNISGIDWKIIWRTKALHKIIIENFWGKQIALCAVHISEGPFATTTFLSVFFFLFASFNIIFLSDVIVYYVFRIGLKNNFVVSLNFFLEIFVLLVNCDII